MKRPKKPRTVSAPPVSAADPPVPRLDHDVLQPGDVVTLPDGGLGSIEKIVGSDAYVVEWQKQIGRGPWIFPVSDLAPVAP